MIQYRKGDLLSVTSGVIAHGVNCQGVMGAGVAMSIRKKYPRVYRKYLNYCNPETFERSSELLGKVQFVQAHEKEQGEQLIIANCFTQDFYGIDQRHVNYEAVAKCFKQLSIRASEYGQLNIPKIGAGLAGGDWNVIEAIIKSEYKDDVVVWEL